MSSDNGSFCRTMPCTPDGCASRGAGRIMISKHHPSRGSANSRAGSNGPETKRNAEMQRTRRAAERVNSFARPRIERLGVTKIFFIAGGHGVAMTDGEGIKQAVPKRLWLALDLGRMFQPAPDTGGFRIPIQNHGGITAQKDVEP